MKLSHAIFTTAIALFLFSANSQAESIISPKFGYVDWGERQVDVAGANVEIERAETGLPFGRSAIGLEYGYLFDNGLSLGAELNYERMEDKNNYFGTVRVYRQLAVVKYYLPVDRSFQPYFGAGFGPTRMSIHSTNNATLYGYTQMTKAGIDMKLSRRFGLGFEYRNAYLSMDDSAQNELKSHNQEVFMRVNFYSAPSDW